MDDEGFMREALKEAELALAEGSWPVGCVIVLDGKVIARGRNRIYSGADRFAHAEMLALRELGGIPVQRLREAVLYTTSEP